MGDKLKPKEARPEPTNLRGVPDYIECPICTTTLPNKFTKWYGYHYSCGCGFFQKVKWDENSYEPWWRENSAYGAEVRKSIVQQFHKYRLGDRAERLDESSPEKAVF